MKYIDSEKMIAEIEKQQRRLILLSNTEQVNIRRDCALQNGVYNSILNLINSLQQEQSNINLDNEIKEEYLKYRWYGGKNNMFVILNEPQFNKIAKYFFELGFEAKLSYASLNIDNILKEMGVNPDSKLSKNFKESYFRALDELQEKYESK